MSDKTYQVSQREWKCMKIIRYLLTPPQFGFDRTPGVFDLPQCGVAWWCLGVVVYLAALVVGLVRMSCCLFLFCPIGFLLSDDRSPFAFIVLVLFAPVFGLAIGKGIDRLEDWYGNRCFGRDHWSQDLVRRGEAICLSRLVVLIVSFVPVWLAVIWWVRKTCS